MNIAELIDPSIADHIRAQILRDAKERVGTVYEIDLIAKDGRRIPLEVSTRAVLRDGERFEVQGIAVPSVIRNQSSLSMEFDVWMKSFSTEVRLCILFPTKIFCPRSATLRRVFRGVA